MKSKMIFILPFFSTLLLCSLLAQSAQDQFVPALYVFGDSLSDAGNNNYLSTQAKANFPPYGIDFIEGTTGRFTNGNDVVDFIAEFLGLPFAPAYLGLFEDEKFRITTGMNYASGAAGILPETGSASGKVIPLPQQVDFFKRTVECYLPTHFQDEQDLLDYLAHSIFFVNIGSNDYINNYLQPQNYNSSKEYTPQEYAQLLVHKLSQELMTLYHLGARKIVLFELFPLGCMPGITNSVNFSSTCVDEVNQMVYLYNSLLSEAVLRLNWYLFGSIFVLGKIYEPGYNIIRNPTAYGLRNDTNIPCCVVGNHGTTTCLRYQTPCSDRDQHFFWDAFHPTQAVNLIEAMGCFNESDTICTPFNIQQLTYLTPISVRSSLNIEQKSHFNRPNGFRSPWDILSKA